MTKIGSFNDLLAYTLNKLRSPFFPVTATSTIGWSFMENPEKRGGSGPAPTAELRVLCSPRNAKVVGIRGSGGLRSVSSPCRRRRPGAAWRLVGRTLPRICLKKIKERRIRKSSGKHIRGYTDPEVL
ncbi:uncharacterized protein LOC128932022 isoform X2 [Callithrix jacchus]